MHSRKLSLLDAKLLRERTARQSRHQDTPYAEEIADGGILVAVEVALMYGCVGGTFDALVLMPTGHMTIIDWKRREKLESALFERKGLVPSANARATLMHEKDFKIGDWAVPLAHFTRGDDTALTR